MLNNQTNSWKEEWNNQKNVTQIGGTVTDGLIYL